MKDAIKNNKAVIGTLLIILSFAGIITFLMCNCGNLYYDIIWCFHAVQKVVNGYTMYTEINTILTPIFFWIGSVFIKIFGNAITSMYIYSGLVGGILIAIIYNITKLISKERNNQIIFLVCTTFILKYIYTIGIPSYNTLALLWWFLAIFLEIKNIDNKDKKKVRFNNFLIGVLIALTIFTKQSIGVPAFISMIAISLMKRKMDKQENISEEFLTKICGNLVIVLFMLIYFIFSKSFYAFIDFCIGGLFDFGSNNLTMVLNIDFFIVIFFAILGKIVSVDIKNDKKLMILTIFQIFILTLIIPNSNMYHMNLVKLALLPLVVGILNYVENESYSKLMIVVFIFLVVFVSSVLVSNASVLNQFEELFVGETLFAGSFVNLVIYISFVSLTMIILFEKENLAKFFSVSCVVLLLFFQAISMRYIVKNETLPENLQIYAGINCGGEQISYINDVLSYILEQEKNGKKIVVVSADASYYMAPLERNNYIYDFALHGCLGLNGEEKLIENLVLDENMLVLKNEQMMYQESKMFDKYIKDNCVIKDKIRDLIAYEKK